MNTSVLIVSFTFPPSPGIGGRRWVKFAKYLKRNGHLVKVIATQPFEKEVSGWVRDAEELKSDISYIPSSYPKHLGIQPGSLKEKLFYRLSLFYARLFFAGNYYDRSNYWGQQLVTTARELITKNNIKNLICTVGPFRSSFFLLSLKKEFPELNFIVDYRDPWTNNKTSFGFTGLSRRRFNFETALETHVVKGYDRITAVSSEMADYFSFLAGEKEVQNKFFSVPNGFDREDFSGIKPVQVRDTNRERLAIVFAGTFYIRSVHVFTKLAETVLKMEGRFPQKKGYLDIIFIGSVPNELMPVFKEHTHTFRFLGKKDLAEAYGICSTADFCALFLTDDMNYSFSTKFYEYLALNKKIISFSKVKGNNARFIEQNKLGLAVDFETMEKQIERLFTEPREKLLQELAGEFSTEEFNVKNLVKKIEAILVS